MAAGTWGYLADWALPRAIGATEGVGPRWRRIGPLREAGSDGRNGPAVDDVLSADGRRRAVGDQEPDQVGDLLGACKPSQRYSSEGVVDRLLGFLAGESVALGEQVHEILG